MHEFNIINKTAEGYKQRVVAYYKDIKKQDYLPKKAKTCTADKNKFKSGQLTK